MLGRSLVVLSLAIAGGVSSPAMAHAHADFNANYRAETISLCSQETSKDRQLKCLTTSGEKLKYFHFYSDDVRYVQLIDRCKEVSSRTGSHQPTRSLVDCALTQIDILKNHPHPEYGTLVLELDNFRARWLSECLKNKAGNHSPCLREKNAEFSRFWSFYLSGSANSTSSRKMKACIDGHDHQYDFSLINQCLDVK